MATDADIEKEIKDKGLTAPRVTPADIEAVIVGEFYFTAADGVKGALSPLADMAQRFLTWPVPAEVYPDGTPGQPGRTGTNLLNASQAEDMLDHVLNPVEIPASLGLLTFAVLVLQNGFTVTGESACASPENFDAEIGRKVAKQNAINKIWPLLGYELLTKLANS